MKALAPKLCDKDVGESLRPLGRRRGDAYTHMVQRVILVPRSTATLKPFEVFTYPEEQILRESCLWEVAVAPLQGVALARV